jgi:hypothetical protein
MQLRLFPKLPVFWKQDARGWRIFPWQLLVFPGIASSSTTISTSVLDTKPSSAATEFFNGLLLEGEKARSTEMVAWELGGGSLQGSQLVVRITIYLVTGFARKGCDCRGGQWAM